MEVWLRACRFTACLDQHKAAEKLGGLGGGHTSGQKDVAGPCPVWYPRQKAVLLPVPISLPHAVPKGQALPRTKPYSCPVWGSYVSFGGILLVISPPPPYPPL